MLKRKVFYVIALVCILVVNILYVEYEAFSLLIIMILFPIVLRIILNIQNSSLALDLSTPFNTVCKGETIQINVKAQYSFIFPISNVVMKFNIKYTNNDDENIILFDFGVPGNASTEYNTNFIPECCGKLDLSIDKIQIFDYISLFKSMFVSNYKNSITVMPKLYEPRHDKMRDNNSYLQDSDEYSQDRPGDDPSEVFDLREYADGDNLSRVHWKLSSKSENLIIKEYSCPVNKTEVILVELMEDLSIDSKKNIDYIYETAYALGNYYLHNEIAFKMVYYDKSANNLNIITINNFENLQLAIKNIIELKIYEEPYAWNSFWISEVSENARTQYIRSKSFEFDTHINKNIGKDEEFIGDYNIILVNKDNVQETVDLFYLRV